MAGTQVKCLARVTQIIDERFVKEVVRVDMANLDLHMPSVLDQIYQHSEES